MSVASLVTSRVIPSANVAWTTIDWRSRAVVSWISGGKTAEARSAAPSWPARRPGRAGRRSVAVAGVESTAGQAEHEQAAETSADDRGRRVIHCDRVLD